MLWYTSVWIICQESQHVEIGYEKNKTEIDLMLLSVNPFSSVCWALNHKEITLKITLKASQCLYKYLLPVLI